MTTTQPKAEKPAIPNATHPETYNAQPVGDRLKIQVGQHVHVYYWQSSSKQLVRCLRIPGSPDALLVFSASAPWNLSYLGTANRIGTETK